MFFVPQPLPYHTLEQALGAQAEDHYVVPGANIIDRGILGNRKTAQISDLGFA